MASIDFSDVGKILTAVWARRLEMKALEVFDFNDSRLL